MRYIYEKYRAMLDFALGSIMTVNFVVNNLIVIVSTLPNSLMITYASIVECL
jgi:hypothetical protein